MKSTKKALVLSLLAMLLCVSMLIGTTFAWFTDTATSSNNRIVAGNLDVDLVMYNGTDYVSIAGGSGDIFNTAAIAQNKPASLWEPGKTQIVYLGVQNKGNLAIKYNIILDVTDTDTTDGVNLADVLDFAIIDGAKAGDTNYTYANWAAVTNAASTTGVIGTLMGTNPARITAAQNGTLDEIRNGTQNETNYFVLAVHMQETAGNEYQGKEIVIDLSVVATQKDAEEDSFGPNYDEPSTLPAVPAMINRTTSSAFTVSTESPSAEATVIEDNNAKSTVSAGTTIATAVNDQGEDIELSDLTDTDSSLSRTIKTTAETDTVTYDISYQYIYTTVTTDAESGEEISRTTNTANVTSFSDYVVNELDVGKNLKIVKVTHSHGTSDPVEMVELTAEQLAAANTQGYYYDHTTGILTIISKDYSKFSVMFDNKVAVTEVEVDPTEVEIYVGSTTNVGSIVLPEDATYKTVTWTSSDTSIATVENGVVTGVGFGIATITATADGVSSTCTVTVLAEAWNKTTNVYYAKLSTALEKIENNEKLVVLMDITDSETITGVENVTLDLNGHSITNTGSYALRLYECDTVTIENGTINGQIRIGEHQNTIVKWKYADETPLYGYHPLAPAKNVVIENVNVNAGTGKAFYFTNIEDDLTRANESNPFDQDLYGRYIYKTGYQTYEQSTYHLYDEVFTVCNYTDSVTVIGGTYTSSSSLVGNMNDINGTLYTDVLVIKSGTFSNDSIGRFVESEKYLVGTAANNFTVSDDAPSTYTGKVNNVYYTYAGGANDAITFAEFGEIVYIKENANAVKYFGEDENGNKDELTVVYEADGIAYTGGVPVKDTYDIIVEDNGNVHLFYSAFDPVAAVYATSRGGNWSTATKVGEYGTLQDAFSALSNDYTVVILKDFTVGDEATYTYGGTNYKCAAGYATRSTIDFNGHMITYTGTGACIVSSQQTGYLYLKDTVGGGGITATNGSCFRKENAKSDYTYISGGNYICENSKQPVILNGGTSITISGGRFITNGNTVVNKGWKVTTLSISGGTFSKAPSSTYIASGKTAVQNDDGTYTVK